MLNMLELAKKWLRPTAATMLDASEADFAERDAFNKRVGDIWLAYHNNEPWAKAKLAAGLQLTPEALIYMEREVTARELAEAARLKNLEPDNDQDAQNGDAGKRERPSNGASDSADTGRSVPPIGG